MSKRRLTLVAGAASLFIANTLEEPDNPDRELINKGHTRRVAIIQPAVLRYREPFFRRLIAAAEDAGIHIDVFGGEVPTEVRAREDSSNADFVRALGTRELTIRGRKLFLKAMAPILRGSYDLVILEHAVRNIETYELLVRLGGRRIAFWGHGRTYTKNVSPRQEAFKYWLTRQATWFFGYTAGSVDAVVERGFPRNRSTVLNNTIDTVALREDLSAISDSEVLEFSCHRDLRASTALYLGGIDTDKRIAFLLKSAVAAHTLCPDFRLLIAGNGTDRPIVEQFVARNSWATYLGAVHGKDKALALAAAQALCIPGRVGLVAVDSLVSGTPIVATEYPYHAPEFDYLEDGVTAVVTEDNGDSYAAELAAFLSDRQRQKEMSDRCRIEAEKYNLDYMIASFLAGIQSALG
jgi:glycosyltransferase involved in cell wall biosynthesis